MPRRQVHEELFTATPERLFRLLHTPSDIRGWWGAATAIVLAAQGGFWAATWGDDEDAPDYVTVARVAVFEPPRRLVLEDTCYTSKDGPLPFDAHFETVFEVEQRRGGAQLRVTQSGFPDGPEADDFYAACDRGWRATFAGIHRFLRS